MRERFPLENRRLVAQRCYFQRCDEVELEFLRPARSEDEAAPYPYNLIGTALDYRIRLYFDTLPKNTIAFKGAYRSRRLFFQAPPVKAAGSQKEKKKVGALLLPEKDGKDKVEPPSTAIEFFRSLRLMLAQIQPTGRLLESAEEGELARYCIVLGLWEQIVRAGPLINSPLWTPSPKESVSAMLDIATPAMVDDMRQLSQRFFATCGDLVAMGSQVVQNPTFTGGGLVGGADADFIAAGCLWDIKCTTVTRASGRFKIEGEWLYQLLGYVLLDFDDEWEIRELGVYLARSGVRLNWPLQELFDVLMGVPSGMAPPLEERLTELRQDFRTMLEFEDSKEPIFGPAALVPPR